MEEDLLTAVTGKEMPGAVVAPLPSLSNRLSVADFQRIPPQEEGWQTSVLPQVEVSVALSPVHNPGLTSVHNPIHTTVHNPSPSKQSPGHTTVHPNGVHTPGHTVAPSCSENLLVEVQTEYPASLA